MMDVSILVTLAILTILVIFAIVSMIELSDKVEQFHRETLENERLERSELNSRIMSKDLADFSYNTSGNIPPKNKQSTNFLQEAREKAMRNVSDSSFGGED